MLFLGAIALNSIPAYYEGYLDIKNEEYRGDTGMMRKAGLYCLIGGVIVLKLKTRWNTILSLNYSMFYQ